MDELTVVRRHGDEFGPRRLEPAGAVTEQALAGSDDLRPAAEAARRGAGLLCDLAYPAVPALVGAGGGVAATVLVISVSSLSGSSPHSGPTQSTVNLDARSVLLAAAAQARAESVAVPDAKEYIYSRFTVEAEGPGAAGGKVTTDGETWLAVNGERPGLEVVALAQGKDAWAPLSVKRPVCPQERPVVQGPVGPVRRVGVRDGHPGGLRRRPGPAAAAGQVARLDRQRLLPDRAGLRDGGRRLGVHECPGRLESASDACWCPGCDL